MKVFVTGGAGFIGSHIAEHYAKEGHEVTVFDNLSRANLLNRKIKDVFYNWNYLKTSYPKINLVKGDVREMHDLLLRMKGHDTVFHTAAQTAVTSSTTDPETDFTSNALGTFNVLEAARQNDIKSIMYCSTNKVYGNNVNKVGVNEGETRYSFEDKFKNGIPETFSIDHCEHTPYGCSKLAGDLYTQDYGHLYGMKTGIFRMSCIYGTRQLGVEDQGWVAWFVIATLLDKPITIFGDGKQVRDILYVKDMVNAYDLFLKSKIKSGVFNLGGGPEKTMSLLELLEIIRKLTGKKINPKFSDWRPCDQKVYISDITKAREKLCWEPKISPEKGVKELIQWASQNKQVFL